MCPNEQYFWVNMRPKRTKKNNKSVKCLKHSAVNQKTAFSVSRHVLKVVAECEAANLTQGVVLVCW